MSLLLAQAGKANDGFGEPGSFTQERLAYVYIVAGACILLWLFAVLPLLFTLSRALRRCSPDRRTMEPHQVWLNLVPVINLVWQFITVMRVAESLRREYRRRRLRVRDDFSQTIGLIACAMSFLGVCLAPVYLICGIIYWISIVGYARRLARDDARVEYDDDRLPPEERDRSRARDDRPREPRRHRSEKDDEDSPRPRRREFEEREESPREAPRPDHDREPRREDEYDGKGNT